MQKDTAIGSVRAWEIAIAAIFLAFGSLVVYESRRLGAQWGSDGPQAGYFPFYVGLIICISSVANLYSAVAKSSRSRSSVFVNVGHVCIRQPSPSRYPSSLTSQSRSGSEPKTSSLRGTAIFSPGLRSERRVQPSMVRKGWVIVDSTARPRRVVTR